MLIRAMQVYVEWKGSLCICAIAAITISGITISSVVTPSSDTILTNVTALSSPFTRFYPLSSLPSLPLSNASPSCHHWTSVSTHLPPCLPVCAGCLLSHRSKWRRTSSQHYPTKYPWYVLFFRFPPFLPGFLLVFTVLVSTSAFFHGLGILCVCVCCESWLCFRVLKAFVFCIACLLMWSVCVGSLSMGWLRFLVVRLNLTAAHSSSCGLTCCFLCLLLLLSWCLLWWRLLLSSAFRSWLGSVVCSYSYMLYSVPACTY